MLIHLEEEEEEEEEGWYEFVWVFPRRRRGLYQVSRVTNQSILLFKVFDRREAPLIEASTQRDTEERRDVRTLKSRTLQNSGLKEVKSSWESRLSHEEETQKIPVFFFPENSIKASIKHVSYTSSVITKVCYICVFCKGRLENERHRLMNHRTDVEGYVYYSACSHEKSIVETFACFCFYLDSVFSHLKFPASSTPDDE